MQIIEYPEIGEKLYRTKLPNGLEIRVVPKKDYATFYAAFAANYGGAHRRFVLEGMNIDTPAGVAHFLEHKMFDLPDGDNALNILTANGADPNAFTSSGMTCYYFQCTERFEDNLKMLLHFVSTPFFTDETVAKEQGIIAQEIRMGEDNPGMIIYYNLLELLYDHHPMRERVAGTVESIAQISAKTLYDCHKVFYAPSNMVLCVEGDVLPERIAELAERELPEDCAPTAKADFGAPEMITPAARFRCEKMELSAPQFLIGAKLPPRCGNEAIKQGLISGFALRMLCGQSSPFYAKLYAEGILNSDFGYEIDSSAGTVTVIIGGESKDYNRVLETLSAEVERISEKGFSEDEFLRTRRASLGARLRALEDFDNVCVSLAQSYFEGNCAFDSFKILETVTKEDCRAFVKEYLAPDRLAMSVIEPLSAE